MDTIEYFLEAEKMYSQLFSSAKTRIVIGGDPIELNRIGASKRSNICMFDVQYSCFYSPEFDDLISANTRVLNVKSPNTDDEVLITVFGKYPDSLYVQKDGVIFNRSNLDMMITEDLPPIFIEFTDKLRKLINDIPFTTYIPYKKIVKYCERLKADEDLWVRYLDMEMYVIEGLYDRYGGLYGGGHIIKHDDGKIRVHLKDMTKIHPETESYYLCLEDDAISGSGLALYLWSMEVYRTTSEG